MVESFQIEIAKPLWGVISNRETIAAVLQNLPYKPQKFLVFDFAPKAALLSKCFLPRGKDCVCSIDRFKIKMRPP